MTHAERRLNHTLADWVSEKVHASTERDDDALLAALQAEMTSKVEIGRASCRERVYHPV